MQTNTPTVAGAEEIDIARRAARIRLAIIVGVVLAVAAFAVAIVMALKKESSRERWDVLEQIQADKEPQQDPIWANPYGLYNPERKRYIAALEKFLETKAAEVDDALAPHTRFVIAKTVADHILSNPGLLEAKDRSAFYAKGAAQLEKIRDEFPDFPLNWSSLSTGGFPSLTRQFLAWFRENEKWEKEHLLAPGTIDADTRILIRTERGDMLMGIFGEDAPAWTEAFVARAIRGHYDGTAFDFKQEIGDAAEPEQHYIRAGGDSARNIANFELESAKTASEAKSRSGLLPDEARNRIPHDVGVVAAWHAADEEYDNEERFFVVARRSPRLDYAYTPVGLLVNENGIESTETLQSIFGGAVWRDDKDVRAETDNASALDYFQVPVRIVKVLVYEKGQLVRPDSGALPTRAALEDAEKTLGSVQANRYKAEPPVRPSKEDEPGEDKPADDKRGDDKPADDAGESDGKGAEKAPEKDKDAPADGDK